MRIVEFILVPLIALFMGLLFLGLFRKIMARIQWRYGPPITQPVIDIIRMLSQRAVSHGFLFDLGLVLSLAVSFVVVLFLPLGNMALFESGGLLIILYLMLISPLGIALSSGESGNPNSSIGISRKFLLALGYEVPLLLVLLTAMSYYDTISLSEIVRIQAVRGWSFGSIPLLLSGLAYFLILPAILGVRPFEVVGAAQEISSGPMVEYGGKFMAFSRVHHGLQEFIGISLFVNLFLGGGDLFGLFGVYANSFIGNLLAVVVFLVKLLIVFTLGVFINAVFPRFRIEQAIKYLWTWPTLFAFSGVIVFMIIR